MNKGMKGFHHTRAPEGIHAYVSREHVFIHSGFLNFQRRSSDMMSGEADMGGQSGNGGWEGLDKVD